MFPFNLLKWSNSFQGSVVDPGEGDKEVKAPKPCKNKS